VGFFVMCAILDKGERAHLDEASKTKHIFNHGETDFP